MPCPAACPALVLVTIMDGHRHHHLCMKHGITLLWLGCLGQILSQFLSQFLSQDSFVSLCPYTLISDPIPTVTIGGRHNHRYHFLTYHLSINPSMILTLPLPLPLSVALPVTLPVPVALPVSTTPVTIPEDLIGGRHPPPFNYLMLEMIFCLVKTFFP